MKTIDFDDVYRSLRLATRGLVDNEILSPADVERRANWLTQDINKIGFDYFQIFELQEIECQIDNHQLTIPLVEYGFGEKRNDINNAAPRMNRRDFTKIRCMQGTGLDRGDLSYFARVSEIGRRKIPSLWLDSEILRDGLRARGKHLSTLNEVWSLSLWPTLDPAAVQHEVSIKSNSSTTIDWVFSLQGSALVKGEELVVHLEVKQLLSTLTTLIHGDVEPIKSLFSGVEKKFSPSEDGEINVVCVTIMCEIDDCVDRIVCSHLEADDSIDAVIIWSPIAKKRSILTRFNSRLEAVNRFKRGVIENSLESPKPEDAQVCSLRHPNLAKTEQMFGKLPEEI